MSYIHAIDRKTLLNSLKNIFLAILYVSAHLRPISATDRINKIPKNHEKSPQNAIFRKSIFCSRVAKNMIFGRNLTLWAPESTQKPYIDLPT